MWTKLVYWEFFLYCKSNYWLIWFLAYPHGECLELFCFFFVNILHRFMLTKDCCLFVSWFNQVLPIYLSSFFLSLWSCEISCGFDLFYIRYPFWSTSKIHYIFLQLISIIRFFYLIVDWNWPERFHTNVWWTANCSWFVML